MLDLVVYCLLLWNGNWIKTCALSRTPWSRILSEKLTGPQLVKNPAFYGTRRFITAFTSARHLPILSQINPVYTPFPLLEDPFNIIPSSTHGSSKWSLSLTFPHQIPVKTSHLPHTCYMPRPSYVSWFGHSNNILWGLQIFSGGYEADVFRSTEKNSYLLKNIFQWSLTLDRTKLTSTSYVCASAVLLILIVEY